MQTVRIGQNEFINRGGRTFLITEESADAASNAE